jgi:signal peptidase I
MNFDLPTFLVAATALSGLIWLVDRLLFAPARLRRLGPDAKEPTIVDYARSFFPIFLIVLIIRSFIVEPFRIPSGSMMPSLLVGDFILVNKYSYGLRLPVSDTKILEIGEPQRGDVVVFRFPLDRSTDYIKRVVGVPGDRVAYRNKVLYINGEPMKYQPQGTYEGEGSGIRENGSFKALENLDGVEHPVLVKPGTPDFGFGCSVLGKGEVGVPDGHYFVMGDNRDNSNDSRCWGFVPEDHLVGKAFAIWMNWDSQRAGFPIAWERIGDTIK